MFGWPKRRDGIAWREYVRTTIALRRKARGEKLQRVRQKAAVGAKAVGVVAGDAARGGARKVGAGSRMAVSGAATGLGAGLRYAWGGIVGVVGWCFASVRRGWTWVASKLPSNRWQRWGIGGVAVLAVIGGLWAIWPRHAGTGRLAGLSSLSVPFLTPTRPVNGRAIVLDAGVLRVGDTPIRLSLIEPLDRDQVCLRGKKRWSCGEAGLAALGRIAAGRNLKCEARSPDAAGVSAAMCRESKADIGAALVKSGYAYAASSRYAEEEAEAKTARAGIWSGEAERPDVWRKRMWEDAKRRVADGCPVKGIVVKGERVYVLPWWTRYERVRVEPKRGARWFCTEQEAIDAGWKPMDRS